MWKMALCPESERERGKHGDWDDWEQGEWGGGARVERECKSYRALQAIVIT